MKKNIHEEKASGLAAGGKHNIPHYKIQLEAKLEDFHERFLFLINLWAADKYRYEWLENHTGIPATHWQNCLLDKQFPTLGMVLVVCKYMPHYSYWLMHGGTHKPKFSSSDKYPDPEHLDKFKVDREWLKKKREAKKAAKSPPPNP